MGELKLVELLTIPEEVAEALGCIGEICGNNGDVFDHGKIPGGQDCVRTANVSVEQWTGTDAGRCRVG